MKLIENPDLKTIDWSQLLALYEAVNWKGRTKSDIQSAFSKSTFIAIITVNGQIVGMGRTFDDGLYYGTICDLIIHPDYQGKGYGKDILNNLKDRMKGFQFITLTAAPGKAPFYIKMGWNNQNSAFIWPVSQKQKEEHCA
jgi:ribosomal protein S18 acetylase RimI-like enzyme